MAAREEDAFLNFRRKPNQETLSALLRGYQDHIYNICFQVLHHPEDAEDISQEVLLEVTRGIAKIESPRQFKVWLYRVALRAGLKLKHARARRIDLARKLATVSPTGGAAMDSEESAALMQAIDELDDRSRCMLLEHYFDKLTLEEIGAREGVSSVAVWKRLDRAKERLRQTLLGAGLSVAAAGVAHSLESVTPVVAPAGLFGKAVMVKAALIAAEGAVVGTKSAVTGAGIVAALLILGVTAGGGYLVGSRFATKGDYPAGASVSAIGDTETDKSGIGLGVPGTSATPRPPSRPEAPTEPVADQDWEAIAKEAFDYAINVDSGRIKFNRMQEAELLARLNEKTGPWFIERYRQGLNAMREAARRGASGSEAFVEIREALELAARSGGPAVADYILDRLKAKDRYGVETATLYLIFGDTTGARSASRIPISADFFEPARVMAASSDFDERRAGLAVLGWLESPESREILTTALQNAAETHGQELAAKGLGRIGDSKSLSLLKAIALSTPEEGTTAQVLKKAITQLEKKLESAK